MRILLLTLMMSFLSHSAFGAAAEGGGAGALSEEINVLIDEGKLIRAAQDGDFKTVHALLQAGADVDQKDENGNTSLMLAAISGHTKIVIFLLQNKANVNQTNEEGNTALMLAAISSHTKIAKIIEDEVAVVAELTNIQQREQSPVRVQVSEGVTVSPLNDGDVGVKYFIVFDNGNEYRGPLGDGERFQGFGSLWDAAKQRLYYGMFHDGHKQGDFVVIHYENEDRSAPVGSSNEFHGEEKREHMNEFQSLSSDEVKDQGLSSDEVKDQGLSSDEVKDQDLSSDEVKDQDLSSDEVKDQGLSSDEVKDQGLSSDEVKYQDLSSDEEPDAPTLTLGKTAS